MRVRMTAIAFLSMPVLGAATMQLDPVMTVWNSEVEWEPDCGGHGCDWMVGAEAKTWLTETGTVAASVRWDVYGFGGETWKGGGERVVISNNSTFAHAQTTNQDNGSTGVPSICLEIWQEHWAVVDAWEDDDILFSDGCPGGGEGG